MNYSHNPKPCKRCGQLVPTELLAQPWNGLCGKCNCEEQIDLLEAKLTKATTAQDELRAMEVNVLDTLHATIKGWQNEAMQRQDKMTLCDGQAYARSLEGQINAFQSVLNLIKGYPNDL